MWGSNKGLELADIKVVLLHIAGALISMDWLKGCICALLNIVKSDCVRRAHACSNPDRLIQLSVQQRAAAACSIVSTHKCTVVSLLVRLCHWCSRQQVYVFFKTFAHVMAVAQQSRYSMLSTTTYHSLHQPQRPYCKWSCAPPCSWP